VNDSELQKRIDGYLAGTAAREDLLRLDALVRQDPGARRELLLSAALESGLRRVLAPGQASGHEGPKARRGQARPAWRLAAAARKIAVLVVALAGWGATALYAQRCRQAEGTLAETNRQLADLRGAQQPNPQPGWAALASEPADLRARASEGGPELVDTKGWVMLLPANDDLRQGVTIGAGTVIPAGGKMWTCPWGGAGTRFPDGTAVSMDRSTVAAFKEANDLRQIDLKSGIVSVTHRPAAPTCGRMVLKSDQGTVTFEMAEVTMAVQGGRTIVEVAGGEVEFRRASDNRIVKLGAGQYAVIGSEQEFAAVSGVLQWRIEPRPKTTVQ
jgi:hypothetical protein